MDSRDFYGFLDSFLGFLVIPWGGWPLINQLTELIYISYGIVLTGQGIYFILSEF